MRKMALGAVWWALLAVVLSASAQAGQARETATLQIEGAGSVKAEPRAEAALRKVPGVLKAEVDYARRTAVVVYDAKKVEIKQLIAALKSVGFTASPAQSKYICPKCQATYQAGGACLICEASLRPVEGSRRKE